MTKQSIVAFLLCIVAFLLCSVAFLLCSVASVFFSATPVVAQDDTGDLKITFKYLGDVPAAKFSDPTQDRAFCNQQPIPDERLVVNPANKGLQNVVVYAYTSRRGGMKLPPQDQPGNTHTLSPKGCRYRPRVTLTQVGDKIEVPANDGVGHNANFLFLNIPPRGFLIPPGGAQTIAISQAEPTVASVECNIHPWMKAFVLAVDHPFFGATDENGEVTIKGLPAGNIKLRAWHEDGTFSKDIIVNGEKTKWSKNVFEFDLKAGDNDFGTVEVPAAQFRSNQQE